ncbi:MAG: amino acid adenylation domain-containing protein, partial [Pseudomonadota bacterium]
MIGDEPPQQSAPFTSFIDFQQTMLVGDEGRTSRDFWRRTLSGLTPHALSCDRPAPSRPDHTGAVLAASIPPNLGARLRAFAQSERISETAVLLASLATLIARRSDHSEVSIGVPLAGRPEARFDRTVGSFANPVPVRCPAAPDMAFVDAARAAQDALSAAMVHGNYPLLRIIEDNGGAAPFEVALYVQTYAASTPKGFRRLHSIRQSGELALALEVEADQAVDGALLCHWRYQTARFEPGTIAGFAEAFERLLDAGIASPAACIGDLWEQDARPFGEYTMAFPRDRPVHTLILDKAAEHPDRVAVRYEGTALTYRELGERSAKLAARLREAGAGPGQLVALLIGRSEVLPVALLAVMRTGAAYVPLDPAHPHERLCQVVEDCRPAVLLADAPEIARAIAPDAAIVHSAETSTGGTDALVGSSALAYVIYTSGSTGRPKGVEISHQALTNLLWSMAHRAPGFRESDRLLAVTTPAFDIAALELLLPLLVGGEVVVAPAEAVRDGIRLAALIEESGATVLQATPTTWQMLLAADWRGCDKLRAFCGGEALSDDLAQALLARCGAVWNLYGPTETTIWSTVAKVQPGQPVSLGHPVGNTALYVLGGDGAPVGPSVEGELAIAGDGLARGYFGRPELTAERFRDAAFAPGGRIYLTGDLAIRHSDGRLEFRGRSDAQVKLRGHRIELGDVEAALGRLGWVERAAAAVRPDRMGTPQLVGFVVPRKGAARPSEEADRTALAGWLPEAMRPSFIVTLD